MLSKILQINQNFISTCIIILFTGLMLWTDVPFNGQLEQVFPLVFLGISLIILISTFKSTVYFKNQYFTFLVMILSFAFYQGTQEWWFYAGILFLSIIQSQIVLEICNGKAILNPFDIGFFAGFMVFFYTPLSVFLIPIWLYYLVLGKVEVRKILLNILGVLAFVLLFIEIIAVYDWWGVLKNNLSQLQFNIFHYKTSSLFLLPIFCIFLLSFVDYFKNINRHSTDKKLIFFIITISWVVAFIYLLLWGGEGTEAGLLLVFSTAIYLTNYFTYFKNILKKEIYIWVIIVSVLLYKFNQYIQLPAIFDNITF